MKSLVTTILLSASCLLARSQPEPALIPDFAVIQYAGSIGFLSVGTGYNIWKDKARISVHFGNVPTQKGGALNIVCGKFFYGFKEIAISDKLSVRPLDGGLMISYHFGNNFKMNVPNYLKKDNYYWWHTAMRLHAALETSLKIKFSSQSAIHSSSIFWEVNSNDLYIVSFAYNPGSLKFHQLIKSGIGVRVNF